VRLILGAQFAVCVDLRRRVANPPESSGRDRCGSRCDTWSFNFDSGVLRFFFLTPWHRSLFPKHGVVFPRAGIVYYTRADSEEGTRVFLSTSANNCRVVQPDIIPSLAFASPFQMAVVV